MEVDHRNEAMEEELVRGREFANQLGQVITLMKNNNHDDDDDDELAAAATTNPSLFAQHLLNNIINSFTNTLTLLNKHHKRVSSFISPTKSEEISHHTSTSVSGRGCYKRRKTTSTWEKVLECPTDDGYEWRKYGQKTIVNSKYSRDYYRCTHKFDQRCQATKQVQRIQEKPSLYKITYYDHHTCNNLDEIIFEPISPHDQNTSSILLSFNNTFPTPTKQDCPFLSSHDSVLEHCKEDLVIPSPSLNDYLALDDSISTSQVSSSTQSSSTTLESDDGHKDMMTMYGDLLYDSVELYHHDFFNPFLGLL